MGFKNNTPVVTESTGFKLIRDLLKKNIDVHVYDPIDGAVENTRAAYGDKIKYYKNYKDCVKVSKFCVINVAVGKVAVSLQKFNMGTK